MSMMVIPSLAYIDPGTGAMLLQWVIAGLIGVVLTFRRYILKILGIFIPALRPKDDPETTDESSKDVPPPKT